MKRLWLLVALVLFSNSAMGNDIVSAEQPAETISYCNINLTGEHQCSNYYKNKELQAVNIEKDRTFKVKSDTPLDSSTPIGTNINFTAIADEVIFAEKEPSKINFSGTVIENNPPGPVGKSSSIKLMIDKIKVDNVIYPAKAYISRMGDKRTIGGLLATSAYLSNLGDVANNGTITINKIYKDPCDYNNCEITTPVVRPFYYLGGALLQFADLLLSPIVCLFVQGENLSIPENTVFEIKLEEPVPVLNL